MEDKSKRENLTHNTINNHSKNYLNTLKNTIFYSNAEFAPLNLVKNSLLEIEIETLLSVSTTLILFKDKSFYKKVLIQLNSQTLICSELPELFDSKIFFVFDFDLLSLSVTLEKRKKKFRIIVLGSDKVFRFKATTFEIFDKFLTSLHYFSTKRRGSQENLLKVSMIPNFHRTFFVDSELLNCRTKSGDIILFKSKGFKAKLQRIFTRSRFDHMALILKRNEEIYLLESTSERGVKLRSWDSFLKNKLSAHFEKVVLREMILPDVEEDKLKLQEEISSQLENFVSEVEGKPYSFDCCRYFFKGNNEEDLVSEIINPNGHTFFCSQLVAAAFIRLKIIGSRYSSYNYLPGHFGKKSLFDSASRYQFTPEKLILF